MQTALGIAFKPFDRRYEQVAIRLMMTPANTTSQLMQLRQTKLIGALNDNSIGIGYINTGFDNGRAYQHVELFMIKLLHHLLKLALLHLPMRNPYSCF